MGVYHFGDESAGRVEPVPISLLASFETGVTYAPTAINAPVTLPPGFEIWVRIWFFVRFRVFCF